jgi:dienelactone hydrolase
MLIDAGQREQIRGALKAAGVDHEVVSYPGVQHAFFWPGTPPFSRAAGRPVDQDSGPARRRFTRRQHGFTWTQHFRAIPELLHPARGNGICFTWT